MLYLLVVSYLVRYELVEHLGDLGEEARGLLPDLVACVFIEARSRAAATASREGGLIGAAATWRPRRRRRDDASAATRSSSSPFPTPK